MAPVRDATLALGRALALCLVLVSLGGCSLLRIVAILFGDPLSAPPALDRNNKILWVAKRIDGATDLRITAQRMDGSVALGQAVERTVAGGPGPSIVDLPVAGCWRLALAWGAVSDSPDLEHADPRPSSSP